MLMLATKFSPDRDRFELACSSGFEASEFWLDAEWLSRCGEIAKNAMDYPFRYALHFPNGGHISDQSLGSIISLFEQLNATAMIIHQPMFDKYGASLTALDPGVDLAIENHALDLDGFDKWADRSPGLALDIEHLWKYTLNDAPFQTLLEHVDRFLSRFSSKLQHVHLPGYRPGHEEHRPIHFNEDLGMEILTRLDRYGYEKLVVSEADPPLQTRDDLTRDVDFFRRWQASASLGKTGLGSSA